MSPGTNRPEVGRWYQDALGRSFEVLAMDEEAGLIEVQYEDGERGDLGLADWRHVMIERSDALDEVVEPPDQEPDT